MDRAHSISRPDAWTEKKFTRSAGAFFRCFNRKDLVTGKKYAGNKDENMRGVAGEGSKPV